MLFFLCCYLEVDEYRAELEDIKVRGKHCPKPIKSWAQCGVSKKVLDCLKRFVIYEYRAVIQLHSVTEWSMVGFMIQQVRSYLFAAKTSAGTQSFHP